MASLYNASLMRLSAAILAILLGMPGETRAQSPEVCAATLPDAKGQACAAAPADARAAPQAFARGLRHQDSGRTQEALEAFTLAARQDPGNLDYVTVREMARQQAVREAIARGVARLDEGRSVEAQAEFREALELDPDNQFARQRLNEVGAQARRNPALPDHGKTASVLTIVEQSREIQVYPQSGRRDFHLRGGSRELFESAGRAFGLRVSFEESFASRPVRFEVEKVDFATALDLICRLSRAFWVPLSEEEIFVAADTQENRTRYQRMTLRTFYLPDVTSAQEMTELVGVLRTVFEVKLLSQHPDRSLMTVRAPQEQMDAVTLFLEDLVSGRPQVLLDVKVLEVSRKLLRDLGIELPLQFRIFNLPSEGRVLLSASGGQSLVDQLIASGGINQANATAVAALLAQLQAQQASVLTQPFATFGGGITLTGVTLPPAVVNVELNESNLRSLQHATLRVAHATTATFRVGSRFPILNTTFAPILNSPALTQVIQNNTFQTAFPSFSYEDLGLTIKATPLVRGEDEVTLQMEMQIKALGAVALNGIPVLSNREYTGAATVASGETTVLAGVVSQSEQRSLRGIPGLSRVPGLGQLTSNESREKTENQILILVTPHIVRSAGRGMVAAN